MSLAVLPWGLVIMRLMLAAAPEWVLAAGEAEPGQPQGGPAVRAAFLKIDDVVDATAAPSSEVWLRASASQGVGIDARCLDKGAPLFVMHGAEPALGD